MLRAVIGSIYTGKKRFLRLEFAAPMYLFSTLYQVQYQLFLVVVDIFTVPEKEPVHGSLTLFTHPLRIT